MDAATAITVDFLLNVGRIFLISACGILLRFRGNPTAYEVDVASRLNHFQLLSVIFFSLSYFLAVIIKLVVSFNNMREALGARILNPRIAVFLSAVEWLVGLVYFVRNITVIITED